MRALPKGALSRSIGWCADIPLPIALRTPILRTVSLLLRIDPQSAEHPLREYATVDAYFTRRVKTLAAGAGQLTPDVLRSPVEGFISQAGLVEGERIVQAKGLTYSVSELLGGSSGFDRYHGGTFLTLYLAPTNYHRIHSPISGSIRSSAYLPGTLFPVNAAAVAGVKGLFPRNERMVCEIESQHGWVAVVAVGAFAVGRITASFESTGRADTWRTNRRGADVEVRSYDPSIGVEQGDELMVFHLGSTVVVLTEPERWGLDNRVALGGALRLGQPLAEALPQE